MELSDSLYGRLQEVASSSFKHEELEDLEAELAEEYNAAFDEPDEGEELEDWLRDVDDLLTEISLWLAATTVARKLRLEANCKVMIGQLPQRP